MSLLAVFTAAIAFWGQGNMPACGQPKLAVEPLATIIGQARPASCTAVIDPKVADFYNGTTPPYRCAVVFHEVGHLYGQMHRDRGVMQAQIGPTSIPPICMRIAPFRFSQMRDGQVLARADRRGR